MGYAKSIAEDKYTPGTVVPDWPIQIWLAHRQTIPYKIDWRSQIFINLLVVSSLLVVSLLVAHLFVYFCFISVFFFPFFVSSLFILVLFCHPRDTDKLPGGDWGRPFRWGWCDNDYQPTTPFPTDYCSFPFPTITINLPTNVINLPIIKFDWPVVQTIIPPHANLTDPLKPSHTNHCPIQIAWQVRQRISNRNDKMHTHMRGASYLLTQLIGA